MKPKKIKIKAVIVSDKDGVTPFRIDHHYPVFYTKRDAQRFYFKVLKVDKYIKVRSCEIVLK